MTRDDLAPPRMRGHLAVAAHAYYCGAGRANARAPCEERGDDCASSRPWHYITRYCAASDSLPTPPRTCSLCSVIRALCKEVFRVLCRQQLHFVDLVVELLYLFSRGYAGYILRKDAEEIFMIVL